MYFHSMYYSLCIFACLRYFGIFFNVKLKQTLKELPFSSKEKTKARGYHRNKGNSRLLAEILTGA